MWGQLHEIFKKSTFARLSRSLHFLGFEGSGNMSARKEQVRRESPVDNECFVLLGPVLHCIGSS